MRNIGEREYNVAKGYVQSMYLIVTNAARFTVKDDRTFILAFNQLGGFAAELYFKGFLVANGVDQPTLRAAKVRHDLEKLHDLCVTKGLVSPQTRWIVDALGPQHKTYEFRYMKPESRYEAIDLYKIFSAFSELDVEVDTFIGASKSRGLVAIEGWTLPERIGWRMPSEYYGLRATKVTLG